jgi:hypothetical protein
MEIQTGKCNLPKESQADATSVVAVGFHLNPRTNYLRDDSIRLATVCCAQFRCIHEGFAPTR